MRPARRGVLGVALALCLLGPGSQAAPCPPDDPSVGRFGLCFDDLASGSATSAATFPHVDVLDALVLSEGDAAFLLGFDTSSWAADGDQGILNALLPAVDLLFDVPIREFHVDVVGLPGLTGSAVPVVLQAFHGATLVQTVLSDVGLVLPEGTHQDDLVFAGLLADHVRIFAAAAPCLADDCEVGRTSGFFADRVEFWIPEPGGALLLSSSAVALAFLAGRRAAPRS